MRAEEDVLRSVAAGQRRHDRAGGGVPGLRVERERHLRTCRRRRASRAAALFRSATRRRPERSTCRAGGSPWAILTQTSVRRRAPPRILPWTPASDWRRSGTPRPGAVSSERAPSPFPDGAPEPGQVVLSATPAPPALEALARISHDTGWYQLRGESSRTVTSSPDSRNAAASQAAASWFDGVPYCRGPNATRRLTVSTIRGSLTAAASVRSAPIARASSAAGDACAPTPAPLAARGPPPMACGESATAHANARRAMCQPVTCMCFLRTAIQWTISRQASTRLIVPRATR